MKDNNIVMPTCMFDIWNRIQSGEFTATDLGDVPVAGSPYKVRIYRVVHVATGTEYYDFIDETENLAGFLKDTITETIECWKWYCKEML